MPHFSAHPLFIELVPAVQKCIDDFASKNPTVPIPDLKRISGLLARIRDVPAAPVTTARKAVVAAANLRPERVRKAKVSVHATSFNFLRPLASLISGLFAQGNKRPRLSKEFIESEDDEVVALVKSPVVAPANKSLINEEMVSSLIKLLLYYFSDSYSRSPSMTQVSCLWRLTQVILF